MARAHWLQSKVIAVYSSSPKATRYLADVSSAVASLVKDFRFDFQVKSMEFSMELSEIAKRCTLDHKLDYYKFWEFVERERRRNVYPEGMISLVDPDDVSEFVDSDPEYIVLGNEQRAYYGYADHEKGLMLIREFHNRLREATRHECAHLLGLAEHCKSGHTCCMLWECPTIEFCDQCKRKLFALLERSDP